MKYKLIVCDFDGTLARTDNTVSEKSRKTIDEFFRRGGIFTLSSGRNIASLRHHLKSAGLYGRDIPLLGLQGSVIEDNLTGKVLYEAHIGKENALWFSRECDKRNVYRHVYTKDGIYSDSPCDFTEMYTRLAGVGMNFVGDVTKYIASSDRNDFIKILAIDSDREKVNRCREETEAEKPCGVNIFTSGPYFFECISAEAGKGNGLKKIAEIYGVDMSQTMAFGDEMNDLSMIKAAAVGVAMENARDKLKAEADVIAPSNDADGVALTIEKYCF
ncbi:MAG: HAD family phosphatase [Clostridia bacterium]|nr:HAD family phosphatase [Clostridia bacterium]